MPRLLAAYLELELLVGECTITCSSPSDAMGVAQWQSTTLSRSIVLGRAPLLTDEMLPQLGRLTGPGGAAPTAADGRRSASTGAPPEAGPILLSVAVARLAPPTLGAEDPDWSSLDSPMLLMIVE